MCFRAEVLADPVVTSKLADTKAAKDVAALNNFFAMMRDDPNRAVYGYKQVVEANKSQAIDTLLLTDTLFRAKTVAERRRHVELVEAVRDTGGDVR